MPISSGDKTLYKSRIKGYGTVIITERMYKMQPVRVLTVNGAVQSAMYVPEEKRGDLLFGYMRGFDWLFRLLPDAKDVLLIGGGGFAYPQHFLKKYPDRRMDVAELRPEMIDLAKRYFFLDPSAVNTAASAESASLSERPASSIRVYCDDGISFLKKSGKQYHIIINDAFTGRISSGTAESREGIAEIEAHLKGGGVYCINLATALRGPFAVRSGRLLKLLRSRFEYTMLLPVYEGKSAFFPQNCLLFASKEEFRWFQ